MRRSEEELAALCRQTTDGTSSTNLVAAVRKIEGTRGMVIDEARADVALLRVLQALYEGRPIILCVTQQTPWDHYAVAGGILGFGERINCIDSGDNDLYRTRRLDEFIDWWRGPDGAKKQFWGVVV